MFKNLIALLFCCMGGASACLAANGIAVEAGRGNDTDMGRISLAHDWNRSWFNHGNWHLTGYWEISLGHWNGRAIGGNNIWDFGVTPVFRYRPKSIEGIQPYFEGGIGAHFISHIRVDSKRNLGTAFLFGDHVGLGIVFGNRGQFDLGYRFQHLSNADIKLPNPGINFNQVRFAYWY